ncbi:MAG: DUF669 domain-containing protein [Scytonema sp. CRU_2_7]|nr:DUF669 domain-containing protein [Scytonema sp. CRU_2_7]
MSNLKSKLKQLNSKFKEAKEEFGDSSGSGYVDVPAGVYLVDNITAELKESKSSGNLMVSVSAKVTEGEYKGQRIWDNKQLETDRGPEFLLKWLNFMGLHIDSLDELEEALSEISKNTSCVAKVQVKTDGEYTNVYWNQIIDAGETSEEEDDDEDDEDDISKMNRRELKKYIADKNIDFKITKKTTDDELRAAIEDASEDEEEDDDEEEDTSKSKAKSKSKSKDDDEDEDEDDEEEEDEEEDTSKNALLQKDTVKKPSDSDKVLLKDLKDICDAFGIEYDKKCTLEDLVSSIDDMTFVKKDLEKSEIKTLEAAGLGKNIKK